MNILLTGGASGLGLEIFQTLSREGHHVFFTYNHSIDQALKNIIEYPNSKKIHCDFRSPTSVDNLVMQIEGLDIDVLINNALPVIKAIQFQKTKIDALAESFNEVVIPVLKISQACIGKFRKKRRGRVISILSSYLVNKQPIGYSEYVANKAYIRSMSRSWVIENSKFGIVVNCISPSIMRTPLNHEIDERLLENLESTNPFGHLLTISELAEIVEFLIRSPVQLNGCNLVIDGGENAL